MYFRDMKWDDLIVADYGPLFVAAFAELEFWVENLKLHNFRSFVDTPPVWLIHHLHGCYGRMRLM